MHNDNWQHRGEVSKKDRPTDSLLNTHILFDQSRPTNPIQKDTETLLKNIVKRRLKEKNFDNFIEKKKDLFLEDIEEIQESEESDEMTKEEMVKLFWNIDSELAKMCDFGNQTSFGVVENDKKMFEEKKEKRKRNKKEENIVKELKKNKNVKFL
ncbi:u3 small nucleolar ribonucleoprotein MPP10 [Gurleya vavrai]